MTHQYKAIRETIGHYPKMSIAEARSAVIERLHQLEQQTYVVNRHIRISTFFETVYLSDLAMHKRNTQSELSKARLYLLKPFGHRKLMSLRTEELTTYFAKLRERLSNATVNRVMAIFKRLFSLALVHGYVNKSPMAFIKFFREDNERHTTLDRNQCRQFLHLCVRNGSKGAIALYLSLMTGLRIGEVISLKSANVDLIEKRLRVEQTKNGTSHSVFLNTEATTILIAYVKRFDTLSGEYLFPSNRTRTGHIAIPKNRFSQIASKLGLTNFNIHDLRRTFATLMLEQTGDIQLVSQLLNHRSLAVTQRYAKYSNTALKNRNVQLLFQ